MGCSLWTERHTEKNTPSSAFSVLKTHLILSVSRDPNIEVTNLEATTDLSMSFISGISLSNGSGDVFSIFLGPVQC